MIKVVQFGLGPIGQQLTRFLSERSGVKIVAAIDPDPNKAGKDIGELCGLGKLGVNISPSLSSAIKIGDADVAVISTVSSLEKIESQIRDAADYNLHVVSTCEEMSYPSSLQPACAKRIHDYCEQKGVVCIGTGVNPGFLMDYLPAVFTSICRRVDHVQVERYQNATYRRIPFQQKIGVNLTGQEFSDKGDALKHVGLPESVYMIASTLNWKLDKVDEVIEPVFANGDTKSGDRVIPEGKALGLHQTAKGYVNGKEVISLIFHAAIGVESSHDTIEIKGEPGFRSTVPGGINGDVATSAIIVNAIKSVSKMKPGFRTMLDAPVPSWFAEA
ncbi:MAG: hypothetical protein WD016_08290 [Balneolaceae bacterium]